MRAAPRRLTHTVPVHDDREWDERYARADRVWSGRPNGSLVAEIEDLDPGSALDVGCGEGADAVWLAQRGWRVRRSTSRRWRSSVAAGRRSERASRSSGCMRACSRPSLPPGSFDLVSVHYPALRRTPDRAWCACCSGPSRLAGRCSWSITQMSIASTRSRAASIPTTTWRRRTSPRHSSGTGTCRCRSDARGAVPESGGGGHHSHDLVLRAQRRA